MRSIGRSPNDTGRRIIRISSPGLFLRMGAILILTGLLASSFHWNSAASTSKKIALRQNLAAAAGTMRSSLSEQTLPKEELTADLSGLFIKSEGYALPVPVPQSSPVTVA